MKRLWQNKRENIKRYNYRLLLYLVLLFTPGVGDGQGGLSSLELELTRLGELSGGTMGVGVIHIESGRRVYVNNNERYPMASTYKVPIAVQLLKRVQMKEITLDQMVEVQTYDLHPGSGTLSRLFINPGVILSVRNLLELMMLMLKYGSFHLNEIRSFILLPLPPPPSPHYYIRL